MDRWVDTGTNK